MKPLHILLAEDSLGDVRLTQEALNNGHLDIILYVVHDGADALLFLRKKDKFIHVVSPDIVILDLNMPKKGGLEVLQEMRAETGLKNIPVIILTTSEDEKDVHDTFEENANCYIVKPFDFNQFLAAIDIINVSCLSGFKTNPSENQS